MSNPLVSVIIPCWNGERFVAEAIESALNQAHPYVEVIVIDDGSTDGTINVLRSFGDRIRWETTPNRGGCAARNRGLELSRGAFVQFLDADDILYPGKLARMVPLAQEAGMGALVLCDWEVALLDASTTRNPVQIRYDGEDAFIFFLKRGALISSPLHWKTRLEDVGGFRAGLPCCQEYDLHLKLAADNPEIICVPEALWLQRRTTDSVSSSMYKVLMTREAVLIAQRDELLAAGKLPQERAQAIAEEFMKCARLLVRHGDSLTAKRYVEHAREIDPKSQGIGAFNRPESRALARSVGPVRAEIVIQHIVKLRRSMSWRANNGRRSSRSGGHS